VLAIEGEKNSILLAAMVRIVWLYQNRPDLNWSGGAAGVTNHQIVQTLEQHPKVRDFLGLGEQIAAATGMIKSAAGAGSYLVEQAVTRADLSCWYEGIIEGTGLSKGDARLRLRRVIFTSSRFSNVVRNSSRPAYWPVTPMRRRTSPGWASASIPSIRTRPRSGRISVVSTRIKVVLPAPLGPSTPSVVPCGTRSSTPPNARVVP
jgi:hypothetical protein